MHVVPNSKILLENPKRSLQNFLKKKINYFLVLVKYFPHYYITAFLRPHQRVFVLYKVSLIGGARRRPYHLVTI